MQPVADIHRHHHAIETWPTLSWRRAGSLSATHGGLPSSPKHLSLYFLIQDNALGDVSRVVGVLFSLRYVVDYTLSVRNQRNENRVDTRQCFYALSIWYSMNPIE